MNDSLHGYKKERPVKMMDNNKMDVFDLEIQALKEKAMHIDDMLENSGSSDSIFFDQSERMQRRKSHRPKMRQEKGVITSEQNRIDDLFDRSVKKSRGEMPEEVSAEIIAFETEEVLEESLDGIEEEVNVSQEESIESPDLEIETQIDEHVDEVISDLDEIIENETVEPIIGGETIIFDEVILEETTPEVQSEIINIDEMNEKAMESSEVERVVVKEEQKKPSPKIHLEHIKINWAQWSTKGGFVDVDAEEKAAAEAARREEEARQKAEEERILAEKAAEEEATRLKEIEEREALKALESPAMEVLRSYHDEHGEAEEEIEVEGLDLAFGDFETEVIVDSNGESDGLDTLTEEVDFEKTKAVDFEEQHEKVDFFESEALNEVDKKPHDITEVIFEEVEMKMPEEESSESFLESDNLEISNLDSDTHELMVTEEEKSFPTEEALTITDAMESDVENLNLLEEKGGLFEEEAISEEEIEELSLDIPEEAISFKEEVISEEEIEELPSDISEETFSFEEEAISEEEIEELPSEIPEEVISFEEEVISEEMIEELPSEILEEAISFEEEAISEEEIEELSLDIPEEAISFEEEVISEKEIEELPLEILEETISLEEEAILEEEELSSEISEEAIFFEEEVIGVDRDQEVIHDVYDKIQEIDKNKEISSKKPIFAGLSLIKEEHQEEIMEDIVQEEVSKEEVPQETVFLEDNLQEEVSQEETFNKTNTQLKEEEIEEEIFFEENETITGLSFLDEHPGLFDELQPIDISSEETIQPDASLNQVKIEQPTMGTFFVEDTINDINEQSLSDFSLEERKAESEPIMDYFGEPSNDMSVRLAAMDEFFELSKREEEIPSVLDDLSNRVSEFDAQHSDSLTEKDIEFDEENLVPDDVVDLDNFFEDDIITGMGIIEKPTEFEGSSETEVISEKTEDVDFEEQNLEETDIECDSNYEIQFAEEVIEESADLGYADPEIDNHETIYFDEEILMADELPEVSPEAKDIQEVEYFEMDSLTEDVFFEEDELMDEEVITFENKNEASISFAKIPFDPDTPIFEEIIEEEKIQMVGDFIIDKGEDCIQEDKEFENLFEEEEIPDTSLESEPVFKEKIVPDNLIGSDPIFEEEIL